ncbi:unnamed protein product, partial [Rhizoctonia solani]
MPPNQQQLDAMSLVSMKPVEVRFSARLFMVSRTARWNTQKHSRPWDSQVIKSITFLYSYLTYDADSKVLNHATRATLLETLASDPEHLSWSVRVLAPQDISSGMLRHPPTNLNEQSKQATVSLIRDIIASGIDIAEIYVDALGPSVPYQEYLSKLFPAAKVTVCPKADSIYPIVSAASIAAKVTRDAWIENWV